MEKRIKTLEPTGNEILSLKKFHWGLISEYGLSSREKELWNIIKENEGEAWEYIDWPFDYAEIGELTEFMFLSYLSKMVDEYGADEEMILVLLNWRKMSCHSIN
jgi:hypothetical protein